MAIGTTWIFAEAAEGKATALTLDTTTQTQNMTIAADVVQDVPLNGRDFTQLIATAPGYGGYSVGGFGSLNGTRPNQMNWQIDGVDNNDFWHNIPAVNQGGVSGIAGVVLPIDSIEEFSSQTQSGAEAGRGTGAGRQGRGCWRCEMCQGMSQRSARVTAQKSSSPSAARTTMIAKARSIRRSPVAIWM